VEKLIHALQDSLEPPLLNHGWLAGSERRAASTPPFANLQAPPPSLMAFMTPYQRRFNGDPASSGGNPLTDCPAENSVDNYQVHDRRQGMKNMMRMPGGAEIDIRMAGNLPYLNVYIPAATVVTRLDLPGVALALQLSTPKNKKSAAQPVETQLYFGNWDHARIANGNDVYTVPYPFGHPMGAPFIVNMAVHITATVQVTADLLKMVDWRRLGMGLTSWTS
jgi:hypothetical protein